MAVDAALVARALHARADDLERRAADPLRRAEHPEWLRFLAAEFRDLAAAISCRLAGEADLP